MSQVTSLASNEGISHRPSFKKMPSFLLPDSEDH